jgi:hypothetical protein
MTTIILSSNIDSYWLKSNTYFSIESFDKFQKYFLSFIKGTTNTNISNTINIYDIHELDIPKNKINILLCVENCPCWTYYKHYNKYSNYNDVNIKIYLYNHIDRCVFDKNFMAIPIIYLQLDYFKKYYLNIKPNNLINFCQKKFCLIATSINNTRNNTKKKLIDSFLNSIAKCDYISDYSHIIKNKSCYHSNELLNLFNNYKFVFVSENSFNDGYITEKIFNCYFSRTIPIYYGSSKINYYFNENTFININLINKLVLIDQLDPDINKIIKQITTLANNETNYNEYINTYPINNYDDEQYYDKVQSYLI